MLDNSPLFGLNPRSVLFLFFLETHMQQTVTHVRVARPSDLVRLASYLFRPFLLIPLVLSLWFFIAMSHDARAFTTDWWLGMGLIHLFVHGIGYVYIFLGFYSEAMISLTLEDSDNPIADLNLQVSGAIITDLTDKLDQNLVLGILQGFCVPLVRVPFTKAGLMFSVTIFSWPILSFVILGISIAKDLAQSRDSSPQVSRIL